MAGVGQGEGSTEHIPVAPVEGEEVEECKWEEQVEGGLQKQAPLACWKGFCESAPFLRGIPLQNGLAVCTYSKTDLDSSLPEYEIFQKRKRCVQECSWGWEQF